MKAICYENTQTNVKNLRGDWHIEQKYGYAYETPTHYVHFYGKEPYYIISVGLMITERKQSGITLNDWVINNFGATNIQSMTMEVGHTIDSVWRPSLYFWDDICTALNVDTSEQISQEQSIRLLVKQLDDLLFYIEPSKSGLQSYSHKTRELLISACTEVENQWKSLLTRAKYTSRNTYFSTRDYIKLLPKLYLQDFSITLRNSTYTQKITPFQFWNSTQPTQSLDWYNAYNATKHDRYNNFSEAKLIHVINAVSANIVIYSARFSPISIINNSNLLSPMFNQVFMITLENSDRKNFYLPLIDTTKILTDEIIVHDAYGEQLNSQWTVDPLTL